MERLNVQVHAQDKAKYLGTLLWRNKDRFEAVEDGYWVLGHPKNYLTGFDPDHTVGLSSGAIEDLHRPKAAGLTPPKEDEEDEEDIL